MNITDAYAVDSLLADAQTSLNSAAVLCREEREDDLEANVQGVISSIVRWRCEFRKKYKLVS